MPTSTNPPPTKPHAQDPATLPHGLPPTDDWGPPWVGVRGRRRRLDLTVVLVAGSLVGSATLYFGWRVLISVLISGVAALVTHQMVTLAIRRWRPDHFGDAWLHAWALGSLAALTMPSSTGWRASLLLGAVVGTIAHVTGRSRSVRVHPVAPAVLLLALACPWFDGPQDAYRLDWARDSGAVLRPDRLVRGDIHDTMSLNLPVSWWRSKGGYTHDAVQRPAPYRVLLTEQMLVLQQRWRLAHLLSSGQLRPMTELLVGAVPGPVGMTSPLLVIVLGLYLMYRRLSAAPIVVGAFASALLVLLVMPVAYRNGWTVVGARLIDLGPLVAVTYVGYMILASPLVWITMILAPASAPSGALGRVVYGVVIGGSLIALQWLLATPLAGYLSLAIAGLLTPWLDTLGPSGFAR